MFLQGKRTRPAVLAFYYQRGHELPFRDQCLVKYSGADVMKGWRRHYASLCFTYIKHGPPLPRSVGDSPEVYLCDKAS